MTHVINSFRRYTLSLQFNIGDGHIYVSRRAYANVIFRARCEILVTVEINDVTSFDRLEYFSARC